MFRARRAPGAAIGLILLLGSVACGSLTAARTPTPTARPTARPTPTPTPPPPDTEAVTVAATGVGTWQLVTAPVAILHNVATRHGATQVVVHFTAIGSNGAPLEALDSVAVDLPPNATLPVTADCTDACNNAASATASVTVGKWVESNGISFLSSGTAYQCSGCSGHTNGNVSATLTSSIPLGGNTAVAIFAYCSDAAGGIVGGGASQLVWPGGTSTTVNVSVIVNTAPASCAVGASTGW